MYLYIIFDTVVSTKICIHVNIKLYRFIILTRSTIIVRLSAHTIDDHYFEFDFDTVLISFSVNFNYFSF